MFIRENVVVVVFILALFSSLKRRTCILLLISPKKGNILEEFVPVSNCYYCIKDNKGHTHLNTKISPAAEYISCGNRDRRTPLSRH